VCERGLLELFRGFKNVAKRENMDHLVGILGIEHLEMVNRSFVSVQECF
jgi:hypothetical protein